MRNPFGRRRHSNNRILFLPPSHSDLFSAIWRSPTMTTYRIRLTWSTNSMMCAIECFISIGGMCHKCLAVDSNCKIINLRDLCINSTTRRLVLMISDHSKHSNFCRGIIASSWKFNFKLSLDSKRDFRRNQKSIFGPDPTDHYPSDDLSLTNVYSLFLSVTLLNDLYSLQHIEAG